MTSDLKDYKQRKANSRAAGLMLAPALCYYILFFAGPIIVLMMFSVFTFRNLLWVPKLTLDNYYMALTDPVFAKILVRTFYLASWVTLLTLLVAYPFTFIITFVLPSRREFFYFLVLLTLFGSYLVRIYAWRTILGAQGIVNQTLLNMQIIDEPIRGFLNSPVAVGIALTNFLVPLAVLPIYSAMQNISVGLLEAGRDLGASWLQLIRTVALPLTLPGVQVAAAFTFIASAGDFATSSLIGGVSGRMAGAAIAREFGQTLNWPLGAAMAIVFIGCLLILITAGWWVLAKLVRLQAVRFLTNFAL